MGHEKLFVMAGNYRQARDYADKKGVPPSRLVYFATEQSTRGQRGAGKVIHIIGTAVRKRDFQAALLSVQRRGFSILYV